MDVDSSLGGLRVESGSTPELVAVVVGLGIGTGGEAEFAGAGSIVLNQMLTSSDAYVSRSDVDVAGDVTIKASDDPKLDVGAGGVAGMAKGTAVGAAVVLNSIVSADGQVAGGIHAYVDDSDITTTGGSVTVEADSQTEIVSVAVGAAVVPIGLGWAGAGSVATNTIAKTIDAKIRGNADVDAGADIRVVAHDNSGIHVGTGGIALAGDLAIGAAVALNNLLNEVTAGISSSDIDTTPGSGGGLEVSATEKTDIVAITVGGAAGDEFALGGSIAENLIENSIQAYVNDATTVDVEGDVIIIADDQSEDKDALDLGYGHGLKTGDGVVYDNHGGTSIRTLNPDGTDGPRLTDQAVYYVIVDEFNPAEVRLAATEEDAND
ncbi:MAG: hypothetical protein GY741_11220, partial [Phycisphaeraceae bacterium]|nr:hypothetical protein [Phycisphaeraceae bacterium]